MRRHLIISGLTLMPLAVTSLSAMANVSLASLQTLEGSALTYQNNSSAFSNVEVSAVTRSDATTQTYAAHSVLSQGKWVKIRVSETGIHRITSDVLRKAGFSDITKVKVYGYGGALVPERLSQEYLREHDDLHEVATCIIDGEKYFYAQGPVSWESKTSAKRTRNYCSDYGYYFLTESTEQPLSCTPEQLQQQMVEAPDAFHYLYEKDQYAWAEMGRCLFDGTVIKSGNGHAYMVVIPAGNTSANIQVAVSAGKTSSYTSGSTAVRITCGNNRQTGSYSFGEYDKAKLTVRNFVVNDLDDHPKDENGATLYPIIVEAVAPGIELRLDYVSAYFNTPQAAKVLNSASCKEVEYVAAVANQDLHSHSVVDLIIIIPTSGKLLEQAERLAEHHRQHDGMSVRIVTAEQLYNEFSSGTPDISAYRRYLKMFYDRATTEEEKPRHVLLFGDSMWDNRMNTLKRLGYSADDYLLCYETEESYNTISSTAIDDFITILQDNKTVHADNTTYTDRELRFDMAVGRIPVTNASNAKIVVDKIISYATTSAVKPWQNEIMFIGDDGDSNSHMKNIDDNANDVMKRSPGYYVKKVMFDAYEKVSGSTGDTYPAVSAALKKQQADGALIMNYGGHASWTTIANEQVLTLSDFTNFKGDNYSLWFTAGCETVPFDGRANTIGEAAVLNSQGGAIAFVGTVRTVNETQNTLMDKAFMKHILDYEADGTPLTIGRALHLAKNDVVSGAIGGVSDLSVNKHNYMLIGDPAMTLAIPRLRAVLDNINGTPATDVEMVKGNSTVSISGHIESRDGIHQSGFNGMAHIMVRDSEQSIECRGNVDDSRYTYKDRTSILYKGQCQVTDGNFECIFKMPRDIYNDGGAALVTIYAIDPSQNVSANGESHNIIASGWQDVENDLIGPSIYAYLNTPSFTNGGNVGATPFFVAQLSDDDGINVTNASLGHNMELIVDGKASMTYDLTDNFIFDNNSYTNGQTWYVLPTLSPGQHQLQFKAWDLCGNSNSVTLDFNVVKGMTPALHDVGVAPNPVKDQATFYIKHDQKGSSAVINIDIIDPSGRIVEIITIEDVLTTSDYTTHKWTPTGINPGLYMYRVRMSCNGSQFVSKTKKLIIAQ